MRTQLPATTTFCSHFCKTTRTTDNVVNAIQVGLASTAHKRSVSPYVYMEPASHPMFVSVIQVGKVLFVKSAYVLYVSTAFVQHLNSVSAFMDTKGQVATYQSAYHPVTTE